MSIRSTQGYNTKIVANGVILDLFKDEEIKISNNITNLFDIGSIPADFSRTIMLPGTKKNNAFFEHVYDISIENPYLFATNQKVSAYLDFDGIYLASGYLQLNKVSVYENKFIDSYEISLYGIISSFSRDINRLTLNDLSSLTEFNHTSSFSNISSSWNGNLFSGSIIYPLADYGSALSYTAGTDVNGIDDPDGAISIQDFKPAIKVKKVWDSIFSTTGYTYTSSFLNESWLDDVYMVCNYGLKYPEYASVDLESYGLAKISPISGSGSTDWSPTYNSVNQLPWSNVESDPTDIIGSNSSYQIQKGTVLEGNLKLALTFSASLNVAPVVELHYWETGSSPGGTYTTLTNFNNYFSAYKDSNTGGGGINQTIDLETKFVTSFLNKGTYYFGLKYYTNDSPTGGLQFLLDKGGKPKSYLQITKAKNAADNLVLDIPSNMPFGTTGIKLIDFIKGIQKKFNLVIYPDKNNTNQLIVETFNNWYNKGGVKDFNRYINLNQKIDIIPANNLAVNKLTFGDTLDQDYISQQFQKANNREYSQAFFIDNENFFSQGEYAVKTTFASNQLTYVAGTGLSGSVEGINPPPPTGVAWYMGAYGYYSGTEACDDYFFPTQVFTVESSPYTITKFYSDAYLTTAFNGNSSYWKFYNSTTYGTYFKANIGSNGIVYDGPSECFGF